MSKKAPLRSMLDDLGIDALCEKVIAGATLTGIAAELKISKATLLTWLQADSDRSARAHEARRLSAASFDDKAERVLLDAESPFELARAKELGHHYRWRASKLDPKGFGEKVTTELTGADGGPVQLASSLSDAELSIIARGK